MSGAATGLSGRRLVSVVIVMALLAGCWAGSLKGAQFYPGAPRPETETALLRGRVHRIDDRVVIGQGDANWDWKYAVFPVGWEVLPGPHTVVLWSSYPHAAKWFPEFTIEFEAKAGLVYVAGSFWDEPPSIREYPRAIPLRAAVPVGRVVGKAEKFPDAIEGQSETWKVAVKFARRSSGLVGPPGQPAYGLAVEVDLQYLGPDGDVQGPSGAWLLGVGGLVLKPGGVEMRLAGPLPVDLATLGWLGSAGSRTRRSRSGEAFSGIPIGFLVPDGLPPDQFRLAFADVPPLRLPPVGVLP